MSLLRSCTGLVCLLLACWLVAANVPTVPTAPTVPTPDQEVVGRMMKMSSCPGHKWYLEHNKVMINRRGKHTYSVSGEFLVNQLIDGLIKYSILIKTCKDINKPDSCEKFHVINSTDACKDLENNQGGLAKMFEKCDKPVKCPIQPGTYKIKEYNITVDDKARTFVPISRYWKIHTTAMKGDKTIMCSDVDGEIYMERPKKG